MGFPGTLTLRRETLEAICLDYATSLARHGFTRLCFVPSHGGNFGPLAEMLPALQAGVGDECRVDAYTDLVGFMDFWPAAVREHAPDLVARVGGHADIAETAEIMVIRPDLVREERAEAGRVQVFDDALMHRIFSEGFRAVTPNGILGDSRGATSAIGESCIAHAADGIVAALEAWVSTCGQSRPGNGSWAPPLAVKSRGGASQQPPSLSATCSVKRRRMYAPQSRRSKGSMMCPPYTTSPIM